MKKQILLQPLGKFSDNIVEQLRNDLSEQSDDSKFTIAESLALPVQAFDLSKNQYNSPMIIDWILKNSKKIAYPKILGICDVNAYSGRLNFIYGQAQLGGQVAAIYLSKLKEEFQNENFNESLFLQRTVKEAVHELGHLYGLKHCIDSSCVMFFSNSLEDTDYKRSKLCKKCDSAIDQNLMSK